MSVELTHLIKLARDTGILRIYHREHITVEIDQSVVSFFHKGLLKGCVCITQNANVHTASLYTMIAGDKFVPTSITDEGVYTSWRLADHPKFHELYKDHYSHWVVGWINDYIEAILKLEGGESGTA